MMNEAVHHASTTYQQPSFNRISADIQRLVSEKRRARREWQQHRSPHKARLRECITHILFHHLHPVTFEFREVQNIANLNPKKAPGIDGISNKMMIELPRVATINFLDDNMVLLNKRIDWSSHAFEQKVIVQHYLLMYLAFDKVWHE
ncbi:hypothetical protein EVAR_90872_1, partial [Eumeta japonica]